MKSLTGMFYVNKLERNSFIGVYLKSNPGAATAACYFSINIVLSHQRTWIQITGAIKT